MDNQNKQLGGNELAAAFSTAKSVGDETKLEAKRAKDPAKRKKTVSLVAMIVGLIMLVAGVVFLVLSLNSKPGTPDGEYLVSAKEWVLDKGECPEGEAQPECGEAGVVWKFTELGKGTLTTNAHTNDYEFAWALEDGRLLMETDWLYKLENVYDYKIDRGAGTLTLTSDSADSEKKFVFVGDFAD